MAGSGAEDDEASLGSDGSNIEKADPSAQFDDGNTVDLPMNMEEALRDPIYLVSLDPEVKACIICPGKLLKNTKMSDIHMSSNVSIFPVITYPTLNSWSLSRRINVASRSSLQCPKTKTTSLVPLTRWTRSRLQTP
jgi:hypothetical protein